MIQIKPSGTVFLGSASDLEGSRAHFKEHHYLRLPCLLDHRLARTIIERLEGSSFDTDDRVGFTRKLTMLDGYTFPVMNCLINDPALFKLIEQITACGPIGCFRGRIYRMAPSSHFSSWHTDLDPPVRVAALSINLTPTAYLGGLLQMRQRKSDQILWELENTKFGDAIVFQLNPHLEHRVSPVEGTVPKTAFAGWFQSKPDLRSNVRDILGMTSASTTLQ